MKPSLNILLSRSMVVSRKSKQQGVVLIVALILLVVISLFTVTSIRSAISSENIAGNVRTTELATQAADIALRYCEYATQRAVADLVGYGGAPGCSTNPTPASNPYSAFYNAQGVTTVSNLLRCQLAAGNINPTVNYDRTATLPRQIIWGGAGTEWQKIATWDSTTTKTFVLPLSMVNNTSTTATATFKRPPECMVEALNLPSYPTGTTTLPFRGFVDTTFVVTARGFGPEVPAADSNRSRPKGTEVWLQSTIEP